MWVAGVCSLFLQALHPRAVAAVVQNSRFRDDRWGACSAPGTSSPPRPTAPPPKPRRSRPGSARCTARCAAPTG
ncbi:oxygenase MpaB family protein, partial [Saccharopolyspora hordei]|uniref:oxygenase MpaB family protein n=1 Tax=Saccharopolyspora hordei TaxID=1838 RepID=UPI0031E5ACE3